MRFKFYEKPVDPFAAKEKQIKKTNLTANCGGPHGRCPECVENNVKRGCGRVYALRTAWTWRSI